MFIIMVLRVATQAKDQSVLQLISPLVSGIQYYIREQILVQKKKGVEIWQCFEVKKETGSDGCVLI